MTEDEIAGWHHRLNGHEFGDGQGSLACCSPSSLKESDRTERLHLGFQQAIITQHFRYWGLMLPQVVWMTCLPRNLPSCIAHECLKNQ